MQLASWRLLLLQAVLRASDFSPPLSPTDLAALSSLQTGRLPAEKEMREGPRTGIGKRERKGWSCGPSGSGVSAQVKGECKGKAGGLAAGLFTLHIKLNSGNVWCPVDSDAHPVVGASSWFGR